MTTGTNTSNTTAQQQTQNQGQVNPWAPAVPALTSLLGNVAGIPQTPTPQQSYDANAPVSEAYNNFSNGPNFGGQVGQQAGAFLGGDPFGLLKSGLSSYQSQLTPFLDPNSLDPSKNPATANLIATLQQQIGNQINGQFAGAGRDLSGANTQALGLGEMQGIAPTLFGQYNQNVQNLLGSASNLYNAGQGTSGAMAGNVNQGLGLAAAQPGIATAPGSALASASLGASQLPSQLAAGPASLLTALAGLGNTSQNQGTANTNANTTQTITPSMLSSILGILGNSGVQKGIGVGASLFG